MRRKIFNVEEPKLIDEVLNRASYGTLALFDSKPYAVPLNFAWFNHKIVFHGALKGRKASILKAEPEVGFSVVEEYSYIPSYFTPANESACPATQFFKSVMIAGRVRILQKREEKAEGFEAIMKKYQPEGRHIGWSDPLYDKALENVLLAEIIPDKISAKFKFGQNEKADKMLHTISKLKERATLQDLETLKWIELFWDKKKEL